MRAGLIGKKNWASGAQVGIRSVELFLILGSEVVTQGETVRAQTQLQHAVAVVAAFGSGVKFSVTGGHEEIAVGVGCGAGVARPDSGFPGVGRGVEDSLLFQGLGVVGDDPAVIRANVTRGRPS